MTPQPSNDVGRYETIDTCNSTWIFDTSEHRFVRLPRNQAHPDAAAMVPPSRWEPYDSVVVDPVSGAFLVRLNPSGSRILRSMIHRDPCPRCSSESAAPLTIELETIRASSDDADQPN